jgi:hypothetical protein
MHTHVHALLHVNVPVNVHVYVLAGGLGLSLCLIEGSLVLWSCFGSGIGVYPQVTPSTVARMHPKVFHGVERGQWQTNLRLSYQNYEVLSNMLQLMERHLMKIRPNFPAMILTLFF